MTKTLSRSRAVLLAVGLVAVSGCSSAGTDVSRENPPSTTSSPSTSLSRSTTSTTQHQQPFRAGPQGRIPRPERAVAQPSDTAIPRTKPAPSTYAPWPSAQHDPRHSGSANVHGPTTGELRWERQLDGDITPGPVVGNDNTVFQPTNSGKLYAIDTKTGEDRWVLDAGSGYGNDLSTSPLILPSGVVVWPGPGSALWGVSPLDGAVLWKIQSSAMFTSPTLVENRVYVNDTSGVLHAIDVDGSGATAIERWTTSTGSTSWGSVAVAPNGHLVVTADQSVYVIQDEGRRGSVLWQHDVGTLLEVSAAVAPDGSIVTGGNNQWSWVFSGDGTRARKVNREDMSYSSPIVTETGIALQGNHFGAVVGFDVAQDSYRFLGRRILEGRRSIGVWTAPVVDVDYHVYFGTRTGVVVGFNWAGEQLFEVDAGSDASFHSYPALTSDGALIVGDTNGVLRAIADA